MCAETGSTCQQGWDRTRASGMSPPSLPSAAPASLCSIAAPQPAPSLLPSLVQGCTGTPCCLPSSCSGVGREEGGVERSPAQKRRRTSPACLDLWSTREGGVRLAERQGWWLSMGWSEGEEYPVSTDPRGGTWRGPGSLGCPSHSGSVVAPSRTLSAAATRKEREKG